MNPEVMRTRDQAPDENARVTGKPARMCEMRAAEVVDSGREV
jgi:hypothetical protein